MILLLLSCSLWKASIYRLQDREMTKPSFLCYLQTKTLSSWPRGFVHSNLAGHRYSCYPAAYRDLSGFSLNKLSRTHWFSANELSNDWRNELNQVLITVKEVTPYTILKTAYPFNLDHYENPNKSKLDRFYPFDVIIFSQNSLYFFLVFIFRVNIFTFSLKICIWGASQGDRLIQEFV